MNNPSSALPVVETTDEAFESDVIARSHELPVVVDFWSPMCQPCRMLAPLLEQLAEEYAGRFQLVKAQTEHNPRAAGEFRVSAIPAVFGVVGGEAVDFFEGVLPPAALTQWLDRLLGRAKIQRLEKLESNDADAAQRGYERILEEEPSNVPALTGLARLHCGRQNFTEAKVYLDRLEKRGYLEPDAEKLKAQVILAGKKGDIAKLQAALAESPEDLELQLQLATALAAEGQYEQALQLGLEVVKNDAQDLRERSRALMVDIFRVLPDDSPLLEYRRQLASALY